MGSPVLPHVLRRVRELHHDGGSLNTIAAALNREGLQNPYGRRWHSASVAKVVAELSEEQDTHRRR